MTDDPTGDGPDEKGLAGYWAAYRATEEVLAEAKRKGAFDSAELTGEIPDGDLIDPGVEVEVVRNRYLAEIIRHRDPRIGGFFYGPRKRKSRILQITVSRRDSSTSEVADLGTYEFDAPSEAPEFMKSARGSRSLRKFLKDVTAYLS